MTKEGNKLGSGRSRIYGIYEQELVTCLAMPVESFGTALGFSGFEGFGGSLASDSSILPS
jgi:hypothetical protein